jgi:hypothetical protein
VNGFFGGMFHAGVGTPHFSRILSAITRSAARSPHRYRLTVPVEHPSRARRSLWPQPFLMHASHSSRDPSENFGPSFERGDGAIWDHHDANWNRLQVQSGHFFSNWHRDRETV